MKYIDSCEALDVREYGVVQTIGTPSCNESPSRRLVNWLCRITAREIHKKLYSMIPKELTEEWDEEKCDYDVA